MHLGERGGACGWVACAPARDSPGPPPQKAGVSGAVRAPGPTVTPRGHPQSSGCSWAGSNLSGPPSTCAGRRLESHLAVRTRAELLHDQKAGGLPDPKDYETPGTAGPASEQKGCSTVFDLQTGERGTDWFCFIARPGSCREHSPGVRVSVNGKRCLIGKHLMKAKLPGTARGAGRTLGNLAQRQL